MADYDSVKMATLKKAYAEIILNTSKEAAARIMMADRKALCFQKELFALKQEAFCMLVHLKQMLDSKTAEADVRSANQQRKIEELEAQLSEAEGIIVDLREELRLTQDKLEKVKCSQKQPLKRHASEDYEDLQLTFKNEMIDKRSDGRYCAFQSASTGNACSTKNLAEMALQGGCRDKLIRFAGERLSIAFQPSMFSHCNAFLDTFDDVKSSKERCSSCSSDSDEKDAKITSNGSKAKSLEYESRSVQGSRDGFKRTRNNVKYQEAIAALRRSSRGIRAKCCHPPSFSQCRTCLVKQDDAAQERSNQFPGEKSRYREMEADPLRETSVDYNLHDVQISEDSEGVSSRADSDKVLKFTFQRKRKREVLRKLDNNIPPEVNNVIDKAFMEQGGTVELHKSILKDEQFKDRQQVLQVAHQLISLSGNGRS